MNGSGGDPTRPILWSRRTSLALLSELKRTDQPLSTGSSAVYPLKQHLVDKYRFLSRFDEEVLLHRVDGKFIHLPRALCPIGKIDERDDGEFVPFPKAIEPRPYQVAVFSKIANLVLSGVSGVVVCPTGWGKSPHPDEPILMFDGSIKKARDVQVGDALMGPDSAPRTVTNVNTGYGPMVRIVPKKGTPWRCNDVHILSLRCTADCDYGRKGELVNVTVRDWQAWPRAKKHVYKLWRTGVEFQKARQFIDPYFLGVLLGDGSLTNSIGVTTADSEIEAEVRRQAAKYGLRLRVENRNTGKASTYFLVQFQGRNNNCALRRSIVRLGLQVPCSRKFIPDSYKIASREQRLNLLAGLLDSYGYLNSGCFDFVSKSERLADDVAYVARSLGMAAYVTRCTKSSQTGSVGSYFRCILSGDTHEIPCRVARKKASPRKQLKDVTNVGFSVEPLGHGEYRGIAIDGDHLYLLGDFTVTHNTMAGLHAIQTIQRKSLVITTKEDIFTQWVERAEKFLGLHPSEVGIIRGDKCEVIGTKMCVALIQSMSRESKYPEWITKGFGLVVFDETHRVAASQFSAVADMFPAKVRLGLSATPDRADGKESLVYAHIGPVIVKAEIEQLVPKVLRLDTNWKCPRYLSNGSAGDNPIAVRIPHQAGKTTHIEKIIAADTGRNHMIAGCAANSYHKGRRIVVFSTLHDHLHAIADALVSSHKIQKSDIGLYIGASTKADKRKRELEIVHKPIILTTYGMMGEGTSIDELDTCILAMPRANVVQPVGRIRRELAGKKDPVVIDLVDDDSPVFASYARKRLAWYEKLGCTIKHPAPPT